MDHVKFYEAIACFRAGQYYQCHEILEDHCWQPHSTTPNHQFIQGLIQLAVACHHAQQRNLVGYCRLIRKAHTNLLASYRASNVAQWINTTELLDQLHRSRTANHNSPLQWSRLLKLL